MESSCTCGAHLCTHAASLLIRLRQLADWPRAMTLLQRWQYMLTLPAQKAPEKEPDRFEARTVVCLLEAGGECLSSLTARLILLDSPAAIHERGRWIVALGGPPAARIMETLAALRAAQRTPCTPPTVFQGSLPRRQFESDIAMDAPEFTGRLTDELLLPRLLRELQPATAVIGPRPQIDEVVMGKAWRGADHEHRFERSLDRLQWHRRGRGA